MNRDLHATAKAIDPQLGQSISMIDRARNSVDPRAASQRKDAEATATSRAALYRTMADCCNAKMRVLLVDYLYQGDGSVSPFEVDPTTNRIVTALPWGSDGYRAWGLSRSTRDAFNAHMRARSDEVHPLFRFDTLSAKWLLNVADFPMVESALAHVAADPVTMTSILAHYKAERRRKRNG